MTNFLPAFLRILANAFPNFSDFIIFVKGVCDFGDKKNIDASRRKTDPIFPINLTKITKFLRYKKLSFRILNVQISPSPCSHGCFVVECMLSIFSPVNTQQAARPQKKQVLLIVKPLSGVGLFKSRIPSRDSVEFWRGDHHGFVSLSTRQTVVSEMVTAPGAKSLEPQKKYLHWGIAALSTSRQKIHYALRSDSRYAQVLAVSSKRRCHELNSGLKCRFK